MKANKNSIQRRIQGTLLIPICIGTLLSGCTKTESEPQGSAPSAETSPPTESNTNITKEQSNPQSEAGGLPSGVEVKKVIKEVTLKNDYHKKMELLTDGGKRITITDANHEIVIQQLEYDGIILAVDGKQVTVQVEDGGQQTLTIPDQVVIDDDEKLGLNKGVEIEWTVDADGQIQSVELDD